MSQSVYWIYDHELAEKYDKDQDTFKELIESGFLALIQFRAKDLNLDEFSQWAKPLVTAANKAGVTTIINDIPQLAKDLGADGVHVGQQDMSVSHARALLGDSYIIGATARTEEQAIEATRQGADHLGIGTIFNTTTKQGLETRGPEFISKIQSLTDLPLYPIGGIDQTNIHLVKEAGADQAAVASCLFGDDAVENLKKIYNVLEGVK